MNSGDFSGDGKLDLIYGNIGAIPDTKFINMAWLGIMGILAEER